MSSPFGELTGQAHQLVAAGDLSGAQELLADALADADPRPANASPELAEAAGLQARVLVTLGEPHSARGWAAFAYAALTRLHGASDQRTIAAAATLAAVLHRVGSYARAARLYQEVIIELTALDGPESLRVLAAHADLATVEYARGECTVARERLQDAWELHREVYGDGHVSGIKMLARLGAMQRDCGLFADAHDNLALARELCRQHLAPDDPLAAQVAGLARAAANPDHACDHVDDAKPTAHPQDAGHGAVPRPRVPEEPVDRSGATGDAYPAEPDGFRTHPGGQPEGWAAGGGYRPDADDRSYAHDRRFTVTGRYGDDPDGDDWWPPEGEVNRPEEPAAAPGPAVPPLPPSVVGLTGAPHAEESPGVHRVAHLPVRVGSRLPVHVPRPPADPSRRLAPLIVAGVVVVLLGTGAVIAGVARVGEPASQPPPAPGTQAATSATPGGTAKPASGAPGAPPSGVTLRDNRDSVTLNWTYPAGAEGPVVVSGGRVGQDPRAFQELRAGSTNYIVYGLDRGTDYCFTVAVVHSADTVGRAKPVCTKRS
ncbi:tetratricopeptide repeat protein [Micromonospora inyonensis]|uniref:Fibronectin type-III domain-containing protein n=1 Tax=Micromonospora inyonensis TaxID=47866 RepID=A0A1C6SPM0_9ACTN|nr:tetratricopeptide repeat protein [Micromonospora inyonensis]SCL31145.1 hypothetical protein GA0074694_5897 [Micromonospora inyonensis]